jgi:hypothetical protein
MDSKQERDAKVRAVLVQGLSDIIKLTRIERHAAAVINVLDADSEDQSEREWASYDAWKVETAEELSRFFSEHNAIVGPLSFQEAAQRVLDIVVGGGQCDVCGAPWPMQHMLSCSER